LQIKHLQIKNFRCFKTFDISFESKVSVISGDNGTGKSSLLEAIHYLCYMRSFRTHSPRDLIRFESDNFFVKASFLSNRSQESDGVLCDELQVGFSQNKKIVKLNKKNISSFKDLMDYYRVVTLTEDDLLIIKGGPDVRRSFLDQAILLCDHTFLEKIKEFKKVLEQRNRLLQANVVNMELYDLWTAQLWEKSIYIQKVREKLIKMYESRVNKILKQTFEDKISISFEYRSKYVDLQGDFDGFMKKIDKFRPQELRFRRSLFGAHLDDFTIQFQRRKSKLYASRGQQKLVVLLLKVVQLLDLSEKRGVAVFLLDDFMTDLDHQKATLLANFLVSLDSQLIFTSPSQSGFFEDLLYNLGGKRIKLTH